MSVTVPRVLAWSSIHRLPDGLIITVDHRWALRRIWERSTHGDDPSWTVQSVGPFVLAFRVLC